MVSGTEMPTIRALARGTRETNAAMMVEESMLESGVLILGDEDKLDV
jgi:hypothetical protein